MTDSILKREDGIPIAYTFERGSRPLCVVYLHGWTAQRHSPKGDAVAHVARARDCCFLSLDYTAHGESGGQPVDFTVGQGIQDVQDVITATAGDMPLVFVGNSIGGWIGLWLAESLSQTRGFVGLAPALDITEYVWKTLLSDEARAALERGQIIGPSPETQGFCLTPDVFADGRAHQMLNRPIRFNGPVHLVLGDHDERVEWARLLKIKDMLTSSHVALTLMKGANHHLSRETDLRAVQTLVSDMVENVLS